VFGEVDPVAATYAQDPLLFWVLGSLLVYALVTNILWLTRSQSFWRATPIRWLMAAGRFLFYLGVPYLALGGWPRQPHQGLLSLDDMGIVGLTGNSAGSSARSLQPILSTAWPVTRWLQAAGVGLGLGLVTLLFLTLAWANANRRADGTRLRFRHRPWWAILVEGLYLEVHWAFYRGALAVLLEDLYAGVFGGVALVFVQWSLNPFWRKGWWQESRAAGRWLRAALVLLSAMIYLFTRNLWICLAIHWLLEPALRYLGRERRLFPETTESA
jgi:hypothetical protein